MCIRDSDKCVRGHDWLPDADPLVGNPTEGDDRSSWALRTEAGEGLRVATFGERGNGEELGGGDHALPTSAVDADLEHG